MKNTSGYRRAQENMSHAEERETPLKRVEVPRAQPSMQKSVDMSGRRTVKESYQQKYANKLQDDEEEIKTENISPELRFNYVAGQPETDDKLSIQKKQDR